MRLIPRPLAVHGFHPTLQERFATLVGEPRLDG
jgi:hypothetical protein